MKKIYKIAAHSHALGVIECSKIRDLNTGKILETVVHCNGLQGKDCVIFDDICDGGRTFIEIAKILKERDCGKIELRVTHGFFTKGLQVFDGLIDKIFTHEKRIK